MSNVWLSLILLQLLSGTHLLCAIQDPDWWKHVITYQIYPRSFQDSNGDGVGDLKGIESRLDYLQYIGIGAIWISPIYTSPMADFGYDVADYIDIDPIFGTMADFDDLLKAIHDRGMYLIMDFIPNHTSDLHTWFQKSRLGGIDNPYANYYRWHPGHVTDDGSRVPPNNWLSIFGGSAWEWDEIRQEFYYHQFLKEQPDLDYRNPNVKQDIEGALRFWLNKGVDGFRVDAIGTMFEVEDLSKDEPVNPNPGHESFQHGYLLHPYTMDQPEIHDVIQQWRHLFYEHDTNTGCHTFMVMEIYDETLVESMKYYHSGADMPFNFGLLQILEPSCDGACIHDDVHKWLTTMPEGKWPNFVIGNHDNRRITDPSRKGSVYANALNMMLLTLPGAPTTYYGEELAMECIEVSYEDVQDPYGKNMGPELYVKYGRDPARAPMQWSAERNAGFSIGEKTWLPVNPDYVNRNAEKQMKDPRSPLQLYRRLANLRREPAFRNNNVQGSLVNDNIFSYVRSEPGGDRYLIAINAGNDVSTENFNVADADDVITLGTMMLYTGNVESTLVEGRELELSNITLKPGDGLVIKLNVVRRKDEL